MRRLLLLLALAAPLGGQEVVDTITVEVYGVPSALDVVGPLRGYVGDTLMYVFEPVDSTGAPTLAVVTASVADTARARIVEEGEDYIRVLLLRPGRLSLIFNVDRFDRLAIGGTYGPGTGPDEGRFQWAESGPFVFRCTGPETDPCENRPSAFMCAVGFAGNVPVFASNRDCAFQAGLVTGLGLPDVDRTMLATVLALRTRIVPLSAFRNYSPIGIPTRVLG